MVDVKNDELFKLNGEFMLVLRFDDVGDVVRVKIIWGGKWKGRVVGGDLKRFFWLLIVSFFDFFLDIIYVKCDNFVFMEGEDGKFEY